jgi:hypothetical protein
VTDHHLHPRRRSVPIPITFTTLALAAVLAGQPAEAPPILFDTISPKAAAALHGQQVTITFTPAKPALTPGKGKRLTTWAGRPRRR